jgi:hypothetical protein
MKSPFITLLLLALSADTLPAAEPLQKWFYYPVNLLVRENVDALEPIWRRAAEAGYTHVLVDDSKFGRLGEMPERYFTNVERVKKLAGELRLEIVPALFPIGYSSSLLSQDVNLIEAMPARDVPLVVRNGGAVLEDPAAPRLPAEGFANAKEWGFRDEALALEGAELHVSGAAGNARIFKDLRVSPWRQYHLSVQVKTRDFAGQPEVKVLNPEGHDIQQLALGSAKTQDWTTRHVTLNSQGFSELKLVFGSWTSRGGELWWREPRLEEVAFYNLVRRPGAPLEVKTAEGAVLRERRDFTPLADPLLGAKPWTGEYTNWHEPPRLETRLPEGTRLRASYYHGVTVMNQQAVFCLSEPRTYDLLREQAVRMKQAWGTPGFMMSHDEVRVANWCGACQARKLTPGQLLADNVRRCAAILRAVNPGGRIYVWSDMFDPRHNATAGAYYLVNGPLTGSWEGLEKDVIVLPWYYEKRAESLRFFAERGHRQVIAGYYDSEPERARDWLRAAETVPESVQGIMYTTWERNYRDLEAFSRAVGAGAR